MAMSTQPTPTGLTGVQGLNSNVARAVLCVCIYVYVHAYDRELEDPEDPETRVMCARVQLGKLAYSPLSRTEEGIFHGALCASKEASCSCRTRYRCQDQGSTEARRCQY